MKKTEKDIENPLVSKLKRVVGPLIIVLTIVAFAWYIKSHPGVLDPLRSVPIVVLPVLLFLYAVILGTNTLITSSTISMSKKEFGGIETLMLTIYSTLINFFGPLQSGPGFRAVFLKKKIGLSIKDYTLATMLYYGFFAAGSVLMLLGPSFPGLSAVILMVMLFGGYVLFRNQPLGHFVRYALLIGIAAVFQLLVMAIIYYIELSATGHTPSLTSILAYTGSANLALFVSFTPGAIGIRESFIYFSQSIHDVSGEVIVAASLLDRAVYLIFLGLLFFASSSIHIKKKLSP